MTSIDFIITHAHGHSCNALTSESCSVGGKCNDNLFILGQIKADHSSGQEITFCNKLQKPKVNICKKK